MKRFISIILLISVLVQSTSQLWIMGAFFANRDYIANNLCVNRFDAIPVCKGSCYLEEKLQQDQEQQEKSNSGFKVKETVLFVIAPSSFLEDQPLCFMPGKELFYSHYPYFKPQEFITSIYHPPTTII